MPLIAFDLGDVKWMMAKATLLRAIMNFFLAYDFGRASFNLGGARPGLVVPLRSKNRITNKVRPLLLRAIAIFRQARQLISRERDDDQEWIPNPRQSSKHLPFAMTEKRFKAWGRLLDALEKLVKGKRVFSLENVNQGIDAMIAFIRRVKSQAYRDFAQSLYHGQQLGDKPVQGLSLGKYLADPVDIHVDHAPVIAAKLLGGDMAKAIFGSRYLTKNLPRSRFFELVLSLGKSRGQGADAIRSQMNDYRNIVRWLLYLF